MYYAMRKCNDVFWKFSGIFSSSIYCAEKVEIGNYVNIGAGCFIMDTNFHSTNWRHCIDRNLDIANARTAPVKIDDFVFVGARSIICKECILVNIQSYPLEV